MYIYMIIYAYTICTSSLKYHYIDCICINRWVFVEMRILPSTSVHHLVYLPSNQKHSRVVVRLPEKDPTNTNVW